VVGSVSCTLCGATCQQRTSSRVAWIPCRQGPATFPRFRTRALDTIPCHGHHPNRRLAGRPLARACTLSARSGLWGKGRPTQGPRQCLDRSVSAPQKTKRDGVEQSAGRLMHARVGCASAGAGTRRLKRLPSLRAKSSAAVYPSLLPPAAAPCKPRQGRQAQQRRGPHRTVNDSLRVAVAGILLVHTARCAGVESPRGIKDEAMQVVGLEALVRRQPLPPSKARTRGCMPTKRSSTSQPKGRPPRKSEVHRANAAHPTTTQLRSCLARAQQTNDSSRASVTPSQLAALQISNQHSTSSVQSQL